MPLTEFEQALVTQEVDKFIAKRRPPEALRDRVDLSYRLDGMSVEIFEIRSVWNEPTQKTELPVAKAAFICTNKHWRVFLMRADLKWLGYPPLKTVEKVEDFLSEVDDDLHGCFWG